MSETNVKIEWYLARDGQQHGPLSDAELKKFRELGHLKPNDLVWRAGFSEWLTASEVFPVSQPEPSPLFSPESQIVRESSSKEASSKIDTQRPEETSTETKTKSDETIAQDRSDQSNAQTSKQENIGNIATNEAEEVTQSDLKSQPQNDENPKTSNNKIGLQKKLQADAKPVQSTSASAQKPTFSPLDASRAAEPVAVSHQTSQPSSSIHQSQVQQQPAETRLQQPQRHQVRPKMAQQQFQTAPNSTTKPINKIGSPYVSQPGATQGNAGASSHNPHPASNFHQPGQTPDHNKQNFTAQPSPQAYGAFQPLAGSDKVLHTPQTHTDPQSDAQKHPQNFEDDDFYEDFEEEQSGRPYITIAFLFIFLVFVGGGIWFIYSDQRLINEIVGTLAQEPASQSPAVIAAPSLPTREEVMTTLAPPKLALLSSDFWNDLRQQDAAWVSRQENAIDKFRAQGRPNAERLEFVINEFVKWRRSNSNKILASGPDQLRYLAQTFVTNLKHLLNQDITACYDFISRGELSPKVLPLYNDPMHLSILGAQIQATVAAVRDSSNKSTKYPSPTKNDFAEIEKMLLKRGWTEQDMIVFSDENKLSKAPQSQVCRLVTEWFDTQLQISSEERQMRLLAASLRPVVR